MRITWTTHEVWRKYLKVKPRLSLQAHQCPELRNESATSNFPKCVKNKSLMRIFNDENTCGRQKVQMNTADFIINCSSRGIDLWIDAPSVCLRSTHRWTQRSSLRCRAAMSFQTDFPLLSRNRNWRFFFVNLMNTSYLVFVKTCKYKTLYFLTFSSQVKGMFDLK